MRTELDLKDKKILYQLDINTRQSNAEIAKKLGLSKQVVGIRIKQLLDAGVISSFRTVIDISKLGFTVHKSFLRLQNVNQTKEREIITFLLNHPQIVWLASCDGMYDLAFGTWAKDMAFLDRTLSEINHSFGQYISERHIATIIRGEYFVRTYLSSKKEFNSAFESSFGAVPAPVALDLSDWKILSLLSTHARMGALELAKTVGLSADTIALRIKKLEKTGVIRHYNLTPNESVYPYLHYKVLVGFRMISIERERALREYCKMHPHIVYIVKALGPWEFEMDLETESVEQFRSIMREVKTQFSDILKDYSALSIYQVHKYNFCPSVQYDEKKTRFS